MNRKLIRPNLGKIKEKLERRPARPTEPGPNGPNSSGPSPSFGNGGNGHHNGHGAPGPRRKATPPEHTSAESFYYLKQMQTKTPMVIVLQDGERIRGIIEWYDKHCLKISCQKDPNILLPKHNIKYIYKQEEESKIRRGRGPKREDEPADAHEPDESLND
jgi:sRNA-binding regulator protein Hfq